MGDVSAKMTEAHRALVELSKIQIGYGNYHDIMRQYQVLLLEVIDGLNEVAAKVEG